MIQAHNSESGLKGQGKLGFSALAQRASKQKKGLSQSVLSHAGVIACSSYEQLNKKPCNLSSDNEAAALLFCFALGNCVVERAGIETPSRSNWKPDSFLWFQASARARALAVVVQGELASSTISCLATFSSFVIQLYIVDAFFHR